MRIERLLPLQDGSEYTKNDAALRRRYGAIREAAFFRARNRADDASQA
jgi:hypothetical protein